MKIIEMLPGLDAKALATVLDNANRLVSTGTPKQREQALTALPLIAAEQTRRAELDPQLVRAPKAAKTAAAKAAKPAAKPAAKKVRKPAVAEAH